MLSKHVTTLRYIIVAPSHTVLDKQYLRVFITVIRISTR